MASKKHRKRIKALYEKQKGKKEAPRKKTRKKETPKIKASQSQNNSPYISPKRADEIGKAGGFGGMIIAGNVTEGDANFMTSFSQALIKSDKSMVLMNRNEAGKMEITEAKTRAELDAEAEERRKKREEDRKKRGW